MSVSSTTDTWDKFLVEEIGEKIECLAANPENNAYLWDNRESLYGDDDIYQINNVQFSFKLQTATAGRGRMEIVKTSQHLFAYWEVSQSFSFPM